MPQSVRAVERMLYEVVVVDDIPVGRLRVEDNPLLVHGMEGIAMTDKDSGERAPSRKESSTPIEAVLAMIAAVGYASAAETGARFPLDQTVLTDYIRGGIL